MKVKILVRNILQLLKFNNEMLSKIEKRFEIHAYNKTDFTAFIN